MIRRPPRSTRTDTLFPYTTLFRSLELAAQEKERYTFDIPAQDLGDALRTVAATADWELYAAADEINGVSVPPLRGTFTAKMAIEKLLQGTTLVARFDKGSVLIKGRSTSGAAAPQGSEEAIVVTGKRMEGATSAAPVITITSQDIKHAVWAYIGQVGR